MEERGEDESLSSELAERVKLLSVESQGEGLSRESPPRSVEQDVSPGQRASQLLWDTGMLCEPIPNGFYSVVPDKRVKELYNRLPTPSELHALGEEGVRIEVILVDFHKDKKLAMLKQLINTLVSGSNPASMIKKIAGTVSDFYKRPTLESPSKLALEENAFLFENHGAQLLGQIKRGCCRARAILFKVLADTVGLESRLVVGLPNDGTVDCMDSNKHMSVIVVLNSVELLVDLIRFPGQLVPRSAKAIFMSHITPSGESDSAENDSCDSPLEPNSPLYERRDLESTEKDEKGYPNASLHNLMLRPATAIERKLSNTSHSEPNIATVFWRRSRRKVIAEQRTASSSPEHPSMRSRGRSMLSTGRHSFRDYSGDASPSSSSTLEIRKTRRRSFRMTPEIGDDIASAVREMYEKSKQNRLLHGREDGNSSGINKNVSGLHLDDVLNSKKTMSLPSSPHAYRSQGFGRRGPSDFAVKDTWNKVVESSTLQNQPLLPYQEWDIDFSELTVGTRVGIGFFGEVFRGVWNGTDVAIKLFLEQDLTAENMEDFCNEISILSRVRHPNVVLFLGACTKPPRLSMITEYMELGSLYYLIHMSGQKKKLSWHRRLRMLRDICRGLMCIHRMKVVHRDLKSANCLVDKHWTVKICDFGLSRIMTDENMKDTSSAGTPEWMAPELIRNEPFTEKCDIFSLGVIMWELSTLRKPWEGVPPEKVIFAVAHERSRLEIPDGPLSKLIADCWAEPQERPNCEEILRGLLDCEYTLC
ncbi:Protein kinase superfamily protein [Raphanus sativus]|uniref:non-specific serine/threonine protein kinase n=1 Tax=Raphanus sativus TaxID=3726 RepID=A0A9W3DAR6_RAPSA|nr:serine/threonine-protein kinase EDR1-like [Raphanus sativus]XP_056860891.1 serine/threonine-protein kinase EDR1-like [Raphanus sativus]XP_056860892.1 serine/threonine-protein kinase EDR1-like [Raphanus sativus]KAJ4907350.1 Protein kinase superfamily protein [Raphanus sativus]